MEETQPMPVGLDVYHPTERLIFRYFNGEKEVPADPMVLYRRIMAIGPELDADMKAANFPGFNKAEEAYDSMIAKLRKVFRVKELEDGGPTPTEMEEMFAQFMTYCDWVKKKWNLTPISPTETSETTGSSSDENPPTANTLASGSTATESSTAEPKLLPSEPVSPTVKSSQAWSIGGM